MNTYDVERARINGRIDRRLLEYKITVESVFIPWSKSRMREEKLPSLNWSVTVKQNGRAILTTDYTAGCAHAPSYQQGKQSYDDKQLIKAECENGFQCRHLWAMGDIRSDKKKPIIPNTRDVIYSLLIDSDVINYSSFTEWADNFGYESDSIRDRDIYDECMKIALQFRQLGEKCISALRKAYQDY